MTCTKRLESIFMSNACYKIRVDSHCRYLEFNVGDYVMIRIRPKWFPSKTVRKLQARSVGPFIVLKRVGQNAYVIDLPYDYGISLTFNIKDLVAYKDPAITTTGTHPPPPNPQTSPTPNPAPLHIPQVHKESIDVILDCRLFSLGLEQFNAFRFSGKDDRSLTTLGLSKTIYSNLNYIYSSTTRVA